MYQRSNGGNSGVSCSHIMASKPFLVAGITLTGIIMWFLYTHSSIQPVCPPCELSANYRPLETAGEDKQKHKAPESSNGLFISGSPQPTCRVEENSQRSLALAEIMEGYTGDNVDPADPQLIERIRNHFIDLPRPFVTKFSMPIVETPQAKEVSKILKNKKGGFFVECGALDGERSSNTIHLEQEKKWTGLLIEMDPSYYLQVRGKNRKSYSINACLSLNNYPTKMQFKEHAMGEGRLVTDPKTGIKQPSLVMDTYCFPFYSLMLALNRTRIDYFSLDVEGLELPILKSIPYDKLDIAVITAEFKHGTAQEEYISFMASKGYKMVKKLVFVIKEFYLGGSDYVFVREDLI